MNRMLAAIVLIAGAAMLQGCVYDPYAGTYVPSAGYGYGGYSSYGAYGYPTYSYPAYGYSSYGYPAYAPSNGGAVVVGGIWGDGYRGGDWDHRYHEASEHREGAYRPEHREGGGHPIILGTNYHPPHPQGAYQHSPPPGGHPDHDHDRDQDHH